MVNPNRIQHIEFAEVSFYKSKQKGVYTGAGYWQMGTFAGIFGIHHPENIIGIIRKDKQALWASSLDKIIKEIKNCNKQAEVKT